MNIIRSISSNELRFIATVTYSSMAAHVLHISSKKIRNTCRKIAINYFVNNLLNEYLNSNDYYLFLKNIHKALSLIYKKHFPDYSFGLSAKWTNLIIKYLAIAGVVDKNDIHCPVDSIVIRDAGLHYKWSIIDENEYKIIIQIIKNKCTGSNLFEYELDVWNSNRP